MTISSQSFLSSLPYVKNDPLVNVIIYRVLVLRPCSYHWVGFWPFGRYIVRGFTAGRCYPLDSSPLSCVAQLASSIGVGEISEYMVSKFLHIFSVAIIFILAFLDKPRLYS
jgi:hypothetical protein